VPHLSVQHLPTRGIAYLKSREENIDWPSIATIDLIDEHHELLAWGVEDAFDNNQHQLVIQFVRALGHALGIRGYNDLRVRLGRMAVHSAKAIGNSRDIARALITNEAWVYFFWSDYDKCLAALSEGLAAARAANDPILIGMGLRLTAQVAKERNNLEESKELLLEALNIFNNSDDDYQLAITNGTWGSLHRDLRKYKEAEASMREALRIASGLKNAEELQSVQCQKLTKILIELKRLPEAEEFNLKAENILVQLRRQVGVAYCKLNLARIAEQREDLSKALVYAKEAETLFVQFGDRREIAADLQRIQEKAAKLKSSAAPSKQA
jgi:tetratricopeptide (TPR) repeat protein